MTLRRLERLGRSCAGLEAQPPVGGKPSELNLVGRGLGQPVGRALTVVSVGEERPLPDGGRSTFKRHTMGATRSGNRFTGSGVRTSADDPCSVSRITQDGTVASVTKNRSAVGGREQGNPGQEESVYDKSL